MEKVALVTGASGYIGTRLVRKLLLSQYKVIAYDMLYSVSFLKEFDKRVILVEGNILDEVKIISVLTEYGVEFVYHMAGLKDRTNKIEEFGLLMNVNYGGTLSILKCAKDNKNIKHIILMGTIEEYGTAIAPFYETTQELPNSAYGLSKLAATKLARLFYTQYKVPVTILRPSITYGEGQGNEMFLPSLIDTLVKKEQFKMSPGEQMRDFIYIEDLIDAIIDCSTEDRLIGEIVNVASGISLQLKEVAEDVAQKLNSIDLLQLGAIPYRGFEIMNYSICIDKILTLSNWKPKTDFEVGLEKTINSYIS